MSTQKDIIVGFPLYDQCTLVDFAGATQVFAGRFGFKPIWLAAEDKITTTEDVTVVPNYHFDDHPPIDILFIPGGGSGVTVTMEDSQYLDFIRRTAQTAQWVGSVCTGAFILAAAGLLENCPATTYWAEIPNLKLLAEKMNLYIPDGYPRYLVDEKSKCFTGGGISSSIDLALELVLRIKGKETAQKSQLHIQYQPNPPVNSGDPAHAPAAVTESLTIADTEYTQQIKDAVLKLL